MPKTEAMINFFSIKQNIFHEFELSTGAKNEKPIIIFDAEEAAQTRDAFNIDLLIGACKEMCATYGGKLHYYFQGKKLVSARQTNEALQTFVLGSMNLRKKGLASPAFVWHLLDEFVIHSIGHLEHDRQPYAETYQDTLRLVNHFNVLYAPPLFEGE